MEFARAIKRIPQLLGELSSMEVREGSLKGDGWPERSRPDLVVEVGEIVLWVAYKSRSVAESIAAALAKTEEWRRRSVAERWAPLVVVPHMGAVGRQLCDHADVNWIDLSGNARIRAPGLNVNVSGFPNLFLARGRPQDLFAPKASRVTRALLTNPGRAWAHQELVSATHLSKGYVSKLLRRLSSSAFVEKGDDNRYRPRDREALLLAWRESYDLQDQRIMRGFVAERTPEAILRRLVEGLRSLDVRVAITGLAAAWQYDHHAGYRLSAIYASPVPEMSHLAKLGFRQVESGANTWLVEPADTSVFTGTVMTDGLPYVSRLQAYLDLKGHPERSSEAADALRLSVLGAADDR